MNILVLCPTRARPARVLKMIASFQATKSEGTEICFYVADDDPRLNDYKKLGLGSVGYFLTGPRLDINGAFNLMFQQFPHANYYSITNDDYVYRTKHWDKTLSEAVDKRCGFWGIANSNDVTFAGNYQEHRHPAGCVISGNIPRALGHIYHPCLNSYRNDTYLRDLVEEIGPTPTSHYVYLPEVVIEHEHYSNGAAKDDPTYRTQYDPAHKTAGDAKYDEWRKTHMRNDVGQLQRVMLQDAYSRGYSRSYHSNNGRDTNPYASGTNEHTEWLKGFDYCKSSVE